MTSSLDLDQYPYGHRRMPVLARRGVVATSQPLAAQAGLSMLEAGGNAVDAAIATAIALTVVEPTCNGVGGDAVALVWDGTKLHGLNGTGRSPAAHTPAFFRERGLGAVPARGWLAVTVPGAPAAWSDLHARFGRLPFERLFEPAIAYAEQGFPVSPITAHRWREVGARFRRGGGVDDPAVAGWGDVFLRGRTSAPLAGDVWTLADLAATLRELARSKCESFYRGDLAKKIASFAEATGDGALTLSDLEAHASEWTAPISTRYRDHEIWEMPPSTQGIAALEALAILEGFDLARMPRDGTDAFHLQIEAIKLALDGAFRYVADPAVTDVRWADRLLPKQIEAQRARMGQLACADLDAEPSRLHGDTVYLATADADGLMVSFLQSNYSGWLLGFGSGVVVPKTGIALHARASAFTLDEMHPNVVAPRKRPFHTLAPAFLTRAEQACGPFGVMGGPMQSQAHVQLAVRQIDQGLNPQAALDAPRFHWLAGAAVEVELDVPREVMQGLVVRGHDVRPCVDLAAIPPRLVRGSLADGGLASSGDFGRGHIIRRLENGTYVAGSDWRSDGCAVGL